MIYYAVTKTAQLTVSRGLAELTKRRSEGIEDFLRSISSNPAASSAEIEAKFSAMARASSLIQRMIEPDEVASMVAHLASTLSSAANGRCPPRGRWSHHYDQLNLERHAAETTRRVRTCRLTGSYRARYQEPLAHFGL